MATIAPWVAVQAPNFLQAIEGGAQAGLGLGRNLLEQEQIRNQAAEAAARIGLGYAQLGAERASAGDKLRAAMEQAEMLNRFREGNLEARNRAVDVQEQRAQPKAAEQLIHAGSGIYGYDPVTKTIRVLRAPTAGLDQLTRFDLQKAENDLKGARDTYRQMQIYGTDEQKAAAADAVQQAQEAYEKIRQTVPAPGQASVTAPTTGTGSTSAADALVNPPSSPAWLQTPPTGQLTDPMTGQPMIPGAAQPQAATTPTVAPLTSAPTDLLTPPSTTPTGRKRLFYDPEVGDLTELPGTGEQQNAPPSGAAAMLQYND